MKANPYLYIFVMASVTYLIRALPLTLIRKEIRNRFVRSFLYYVPYATLAAMTFPAILYSTANWLSALGGFLVAVFFSYKEKSMVLVALAACCAVFLIELFFSMSGLSVPSFF